MWRMRKSPLTVFFLRSQRRSRALVDTKIILDGNSLSSKSSIIDVMFCFVKLQRFSLLHFISSIITRYVFFDETTKKNSVRTLIPFVTKQLTDTKNFIVAYMCN